MKTIYDLITLDVQNEHDLEHDLRHSPLFSEPKIYDGNGDLSKRWYLYFSYRHPKTGKLKRMKNIYGNVNRHRTKESRYTLLNLYKRRLTKFLKEGYNPFIDNTDFHKKQQSVQKVIPSQAVAISNTIDTTLSNKKESTKTIEEALGLAIKLKTNIVNKRTLDDYKSRSKKLIAWLKKNSTVETIDTLNKKLVVQFLNNIQLETSARNRNNYRTCLSSLFQTLEDNDIIAKNYIKTINILKTNPKRNKTYSSEEQTVIFEYLEANDPLLLLYIKFISYNLLRPIEVCRLRVKDINIEQRTIEFQAKNKTLKTKIIPKLLFNELPELTNMDDDLLLFTPDGIGGVWDTALTNRRDYFSKRFKSVIKDHFGYNENYGLYSFRHTFITKLYRGLVKKTSPYQAKSELMQITGHTTMTALEKYLRDIDAELPKDYSKLL